MAEKKDQKKVLRLSKETVKSLKQKSGLKTGADIYTRNCNTLTVGSPHEQL
jgi:hypothetical protein